MVIKSKKYTVSEIHNQNHKWTASKNYEIKYI